MSKKSSLKGKVDAMNKRKTGVEHKLSGNMLNDVKQEKYIHPSLKHDKNHRFSNDGITNLSPRNTKSKMNKFHSQSDSHQKEHQSFRISHEEELELANIIQKGSELHVLKSEFEDTHGREISRAEWTEIAKLDSPKDLRRIVSNYRRAKNKLVMANMGLVHSVVRSQMRSNSKTGSINQESVTHDGVSYEELVQEGSLGLLRAAELFDPKRGLRFSTYATIWIKGVLSNSNVHDTISLPAREKTKFNKIRQAKADIIAEKSGVHNTFSPNDEDPTPEEIAQKCNMDVQTVQMVLSKIKVTKNVLSLDYQYDTTSTSGNDSQRVESLKNDRNLMDDVDLVGQLQIRADVIAAISRNLDEREALLMQLRYGLKDGNTRTINECAKLMGISKSRAQQLA
eukprot:CAMPEP_0184872376 /NCGR_PEP_ID=MMETSP0580-20130426/41258_1 /TAXON_ID=1118495 /ORGANISM="Dactyliosolen fragilissimus" /LENGTH=395 /DNA_ID=CAMNT_0027375171 /DNA_START=835 /DNA_END=2018 /DNA_ORIENTATION=-